MSKAVGSAVWASGVSAASGEASEAGGREADGRLCTVSMREDHASAGAECPNALSARDVAAPSKSVKVRICECVARGFGGLVCTRGRFFGRLSRAAVLSLLCIGPSPALHVSLTQTHSRAGSIGGVLAARWVRGADGEPAWRFAALARRGLSLAAMWSSTVVYYAILHVYMICCGTVVA